MVLFWIELILFIAQSLLGILVGYLLWLALLSRKAEKHTQWSGQSPKTRFTLLVPAHNEEAILPGLLESISKLDYPKPLYTACVVADNCTDQTASIASGYDVSVYIRENDELRGKGYALNWLFQETCQAGLVGDAIVILDADTIISPDFLKIMDTHIQRGERVIQSYYAVRDPDQSWTGAIRYAAFSVLHYLRPQARSVIGFSAGLKGNGMVFRREILQHHTWSGSIVEDIEFHMELILHGERVAFAPDAVVWGEMPATLSNSKSQHARWEQGRLAMSRRYLPALLRAAGQAFHKGDRQRAFLLIDASMEHIIPPFSLMFSLSLFFILLDALSCLFLIANGVVTSLGNPSAYWLILVSTILAFGMLFGEIIYLIAGLKSVGAPRKVYQSLLFVPVYLVWKIWQYVQVLFTKKDQVWIRTTRNGVKNGDNSGS